MNAHQRAIVRETFQLMRPIPRSAGLEFYERLFALDPTIRPLFKGNLDAQAAMFAAALNMAVLDLVEHEFVPPSVLELGARHEAYGVEDRCYAPFRQALLETIARLLGDRFTPEAAQAWSQALEALTEAMRSAIAERREAKPAGHGTGLVPGAALRA